MCSAGAPDATTDAQSQAHPPRRANTHEPRVGVHPCRSRLATIADDVLSSNLLAPTYVAVQRRRLRPQIRRRSGQTRREAGTQSQGSLRDSPVADFRDRHEAVTAQGGPCHALPHPYAAAQPRGRRVLCLPARTATEPAETDTTARASGFAGAEPDGTDVFELAALAWRVAKTVSRRSAGSSQVARGSKSKV
jgi:hypothetical protein